MESPQLLIIDDSPTILKMAECHLSQAGYRVAKAVNADDGVAAAEAIRPALILLDHQLPGTTGDEVCRRLLASEATAQIPVVICSAMRNRAFASYTELPNVVDQIPKPFTPELLKTGVANALQIGAMVVQAQKTGCAMPEAVGEAREPLLEGRTSAVPLRSVLDFLNNERLAGSLTLEVDKDRVRFGLAGGRVQAVSSPTIGPDRLLDFLPEDQADLAPLLAATLGDRLDPSMTGLVRLLERSLSDPRRLRSLLRTQAAILTHWALSAGPGTFQFEAETTLPPMFQAFPLQVSLPALAVEGVHLRDPAPDGDGGTEALARLVFARQARRGGNLDRAGLSPSRMKAHALFDGALDLSAVAEQAGMTIRDAADLARGLELAGLVERRTEAAGASVLVLDDDPESAGVIRRALGPEGRGCRLKFVRDKAGAQLLIRRGRFDLVILALDRPDREPFVGTCKEQSPETTRVVGIVGLGDGGEEELARLDSLELDGVLHRPISEADLEATIDHLLSRGQPAEVS